MAWLSVDKNGDEYVHDIKPIRNNEYMWWSVWYEDGSNSVELPKGSIKRLIGRELTWDDEPVEFNGVCNEA
jgi:hypothetical protein